MRKRYISVMEAPRQYGGSLPAWRRWVWKDLLGKAVCRFGRRIFLDTVAIEDCLRRTGQVLISQAQGKAETKH